MKHQYLKAVVTLNFDAPKCIGCGMCLEVCPHQVFAMAAGTVEIRNRDGCMECGACSRNCPAGAITVQAGVGCAAAIVKGNLRGTAPCCGDSGEQGTSGVG